MKNIEVIEPITEWDIRKRFIQPQENWSCLVKSYRNMFRAGPPHFMMRVARELSQTAVAGRIYAGRVMFNLVVSDTSDFESVNGVLHIQWDDRRQRCEFHHIDIAGRQVSCFCPFERLREVFVQQVNRIFLIDSDLNRRCLTSSRRGHEKLSPDG